jgi:hypothetical protein
MGNDRQGMILARRLASFPFSQLDRILTATGNGTPSLGRLAGFFEGYVIEAAQAHFTAASVNRHVQKPLPPAIGPLVQPQTGPVVLLARRGVFDLDACELVSGWHQPTPLSTPIYAMA